MNEHYKFGGKSRGGKVHFFELIALEDEKSQLNNNHNKIAIFLLSISYRLYRKMVFSCSIVLLENFNFFFTRPSWGSAFITCII